MGHFSELRRSLQEFSAQERRNVMIYILGIMAYKFGLEAFNGSVVALATNRYDYESIHNNTPSRTFERVGLLTGLNQAFQCVGSILIAPLVRHGPSALPLTIETDETSTGQKISHQECSCCGRHCLWLLHGTTHHPGCGNRRKIHAS